MSTVSFTGAPSNGFVKLGQPVPELNLSLELKSGALLATLTYIPSSLLSLYSPVNGLSVPDSNET